MECRSLSCKFAAIDQEPGRAPSPSMHEVHLMTENAAAAAWRGKVTCPCGSVQVSTVDARTVSSSRPLAARTSDRNWPARACAEDAALEAPALNRLGNSRLISRRVGSRWVASLETNAPPLPHHLDTGRHRASAANIPTRRDARVVSHAACTALPDTVCRGNQGSIFVRASVGIQLSSALQ
jgi:hypothetical protein